MYACEIISNVRMQQAIKLSHLYNDKLIALYLTAMPVSGLIIRYPTFPRAWNLVLPTTQLPSTD